MATEAHPSRGLSPLVFERAMQREHAARQQAERLLEERSRKLYFANVALQKEHEKVQQRNREIEAAHAALQSAQAQLVRSEKLASVGQLAAGVAHEINNPVGYIKSNLGSLRRYASSLVLLTSKYRELAAAAECGRESAALLEGIRAAEREESLDLILADIDELIGESLDGTVRVAEIVQGLKSFSRIDGAEMSRVDIHVGIESTLKVVANELKYNCVVKRDFGTLPKVLCNLAKLNQVFMNLLVNAGQAIEGEGAITIRTRSDGTDVVIQVNDTGSGIPVEMIGSVFDPFFTSKPVGSGTGLGLSISYGIIEEHGGSLDVESEVGVGTTFTIRLPVNAEFST